MQAKLKLVEFIAGKLNVYLRGFQTDKPMVPFMHDVLKDILTSILKMFILSDTIKKANSVLKLLQIDVSDVSINKPGSSIDIGVGAKLKVLEYKNSSMFKESTLRQFYKGVCLFLSGATMHMMHKSPIKLLIIRCANSLDTTLLVKAEEEESCKVKFAKLVEMNLKINSAG